MNDLNRRLAIGAVVLLLLSAFTYWNDVTSAERFERGQKLLPNLNPDDIGTVKITKGDSTVTLERGGSTLGRDEYTIVEKKGYLAKNEAVNRFVRDLLDIGLEKEIGTSESLAEELGIEPPSEEAVDVVLENSGGQTMVHLRLGNRLEGGNGRYVRRLDQEDAAIYLTSSSPNLETAASNFLRKEIVDVPSGDIVRVEGPDFLLAQAEPAAPAGEEEGEDASAPAPGPVELQDVPSGKKAKSSEISSVKSAFSRLQFDEVFLADDPEVADLDWRRAYRTTLKDRSGYAVMLAEKDERTFLRVSAFLDVDRIEITREESDEELKEKSGILKRNQEVQDFNDYHNSWVYEVTDTVGDKFKKRKADLLEDA